MKKTWIALLLAITLTAVGCKSGNNSTVVNLKASDVDVWSVPATEKVLYDIDTDFYSDVRQKASIDLTMTKNEYEGAQIIITPDKYVAEYDVRLGEIKRVGGTEVFPAENVSVYVEKYVNVSVIFDKSATLPTGKVPDALVPIAAIKKYKQNTIEKDSNQGIYLTFKTPSDMTEGTYEGSITIDFGKFEKQVPVSIEVLDISVSENVRSHSLFNIGFPFENGELNATQEMLDAYVKALFEYRLSPGNFMYENSHTDEDIALYTEKAYEFMQDPRCTDIVLPYAYKSVEGVSSFDPDIFKKYIKSLVNKSVEEDFDMLAKIVFYVVDEPQNANQIDLVRVETTQFEKVIKELGDELTADSTIPSDKKSGLLTSLNNIPNIITAHYDEVYGQYIKDWCPTIDNFDSELQRSDYEDQRVRWWYTCCSPRVPYPSYHLEDTLLSARAMGWMQAEYDVPGNLYWSTDVYASWNSTKSIYEPIDEYYESNGTRFPVTNGDGWLFYPGGQYGLNKPVGSMRLEAIRDGLEEYDMLLSLKDIYAKYKYDATNVISSLGADLYFGTRVATDNETFAAARNSLLQLTACAQSDAEMCIVDSSDDGYGNVQYKVFLKDGYSLKCNGQDVTTVENVEGGKQYTVSISRTNETNNMTLSFMVGDKKYEYSHNLGGKVIIGKAEDLSNAFSGSTVVPTVSVVEASTVNSSLKGKLVKVEIPASDDDVQAIKFVNSVITGLDSDSDKLILNIYNPNSESIEFSVAAKFKNNRILSELVKVTLAQGMNTVEISVNTINWKYGSVEYFEMQTGTSVKEAARDIYFGDMVLYSK